MLIQNETALRAIREQAKLTQAEGYPQNLLPNVQAVMDMSPEFHVYNSNVFSVGSGATGVASVYTGSPGKRLVITGYLFTIAKDVTCDQSTTSLSIIYTKNGVAQTLCSIAVLTLTVQTETIMLTLKDPIYTDNGTSVTSSVTFTAGTLRRTAMVYGYEESVTY